MCIIGGVAAWLAHHVTWLDPNDDKRNGAAISGKLGCSQRVGKHLGSI